MKIVTFNLRCDNNHDGENRWQFRKGIVLDRLEAEAADVVGFQEVKPEMADFLRRHLNGYLCVGCGRSAEFAGENNMIAFRQDRYELMRLVKLTWDPDWVLNRHKIVDTLPMDSMLRFDEDQQYEIEKLIGSDHTYFNWKAAFDECDIVDSKTGL